jgi:hypothetical protein
MGFKVEDKSRERKLKLIAMLVLSALGLENDDPKVLCEMQLAT